MTKKILIIGGDGFLGTNLAKKLKTSNKKLFLLCKNKKKISPKITNVKYIYCNLGNLKKLKKVLNRNFDIIINFSGNIDHSNKKETFETHYKGIINIFNCIKKKNLKIFIQAGSSLEYGKMKSPQLEKLKTNPISFYGKAKYLASKFILKFQRDFKIIILRMYQIYGPFQKSNRLIPQVINSCIHKKNFPCTDGKQLRDFLYVDDLNNLILKIIKKKKLKSGIYNVGSGKPTQVKKIIKKIVNISHGGKPNFGEIQMRKDELNNLYPNIQKIKKNFKWSPKVSLEEGLKKTIKFYEKK